jgi:hypothetical protein
MVCMTSCREDVDEPWRFRIRGTNRVTDAKPEYTQRARNLIKKFVHAISGSHGGEYKDECLLWCCTV